MNEKNIKHNIGENKNLLKSFVKKIANFYSMVKRDFLPNNSSQILLYAIVILFLCIFLVLDVDNFDISNNMDEIHKYRFLVH